MFGVCDMCEDAEVRGQTNTSSEGCAEREKDVVEEEGRLF